MILKDRQEDLGTSVITQWTFHIECDKCKALVQATMPTREQTQRFLYELGWRVNSRARKYFHLCRKCAK
jgi:hypothetical protein